MYNLEIYKNNTWSYVYYSKDLTDLLKVGSTIIYGMDFEKIRIMKYENKGRIVEKIFQYDFK